MILIRLFFEFFKAGLFAIGGGLATLPFLYTMSDTTGWFTYDQLTDMIAVSESTPGAIGINMATYVGYLTDKIPGGIIATIGLVTPSIIVILIIASFLKNFGDNKYVKGAFYGLRPASTALISSAGLTVAVGVFFKAYSESGNLADLINLNWKAVILAAALLFFTRGFKKTKGLHPIVFILASAVVGIVFKFAGV
jgi:chromate transporter